MSHFPFHLVLAGIRKVLLGWRRYVLTLVVTALAIALRALLTPIMGQQGITVFLAAVLVNAWIGGVGPAILTLFVLHTVHGYWFSDPRGLLQPNLASVATTLGYYLVGITVGLLSQLRSAAQQRAREQQHEADSQREQLRATLLCMADGVLVTDIDGRLTLINPTAEAMTGWQTADAIGKPWWEVLAIRRDDGQEVLESPIDRVLQELRVVHETEPLTLTSRSGQVLPIAYNAAPVQDPDGRIQGVVLVFRDESERRRSELALRDADRRKDEFLATLAHELRNPLAPILLGLELLEISIDDRQAVSNVCAMLERQSKHMVRLVDDLLDVSRITRGKLELRRSPVDLREIIRNAVEAARPVIDESGHQLTVRMPDEHFTFYADADRLTQVLTNLLNNAAKYTPRQGRIELLAECTASSVSVTVSDTGIGIPDDKLDRVFDMFARINNSSESGHSGLGIGLTLAKRLVEMHGGSVAVQSGGRNQGSTFTVQLPAMQASSIPKHDAGYPAPELASSTKRRVLVVDDNADALETLSCMVKLMGNDVRRAQDGVDAIEIASTFHPDVVLMDLGMPRLNGYEAARRMRQEPWGRELTLIAITGWGQDEDRRRSAEAGFDCHLVKPVEIASLREALCTVSMSRS